MSAESISLVAGALLSLAFSYIPGLRQRFEVLEATQKRLVMLGLLLCTAALVQGISCLGWAAWWRIPLTCDESGLAGLLEQLVLAIMANQSVFAISPRRPV